MSEITREEKKWRLAMLAAIVVQNQKYTVSDAAIEAMELVQAVESAMASRWQQSGHTTRWEDGGAVSVRCSANALVEFSMSNDDADSRERACPVCGKKLRLVWDVRIEEVL